VVGKRIVHRHVVDDSANDNAWGTPPHRSRGMR
jgi:hypothetical protein